MPEWTIRSATLDDRDAALRLMARAFAPDANHPALWDWAFVRNPCTSDLYYLVADTGDGLAAQCAAIPVAMVHQGRRIRGLITIFTATDPAFQRLGLFRALAERLYERTTETCPIVYGFPNRRSAPTYYKHLGRVELRPFPQLRRPLRNRGRYPEGNSGTAMAARALDMAGLIGRDRTIGVSLVDDFTGIANPIWQELEPHAGTAIVRDEAFLNWRFVQSPFQYLRFVAVRDGEPVGLAVLAADSSDGKARMMEFMVKPSETAGVARALLSHVIGAATESGAYGLGFIATRRHPQWRALLAAGLLPVMGERLRASRLGAGENAFGVRVNGPGVDPRSVLDIDSWYLSGADQDWL
jgi:GNAT superfamily N-acetyltransferase